MTLRILEPPWEGEDVSAIVRNTLHGRRCDVHVTYTAPLHDRSGELHFAVWQIWYDTRSGTSSFFHVFP